MPGQGGGICFDSDWDDISSNIKINDPVEKRPRNFYSAARNFKEYMRSLKNRDIYLEIFVGHIRKMMQGTRGLMTCWPILFGKEDELAADFDYACNDKKGSGQYVEMFKITGFTDHRLMELWCLHSHEAFAERHKDLLKNLPEFLSTVTAGNSMRMARSYRLSPLTRTSSSGVWSRGMRGKITKDRIMSFVT